MISDDERKSILGGARWSAMLRLSAQVFSWIVTIVVVRFISPEDYGLNAMLEAPLGVMLMVSALGLDAALVQAKGLEKEQLQSAFGWLLVTSFAVFLAYFFGGALLATYFNEPRLDPLAKALSVIFILSPFRVIPNALLDRELKFKAKAVVELVATVAAAAATLVMAVGGAGIWALIVGLILNRVVGAVLLMVYHPWFLRPTLDLAMLPLIRFGGVMMLSGSLVLVSGALVSLIAGPILGTHQLGVYSVAFQFAMLPLARLMPLLNPIIMPTFSRLQSHPAQAGYYLGRAITFAAIFIFPVMIGLACVAPDFVDVVFGKVWADAVLPLALLSLAMPFRLVTTFVQPVVTGMGRPDVSLKSVLLKAVLLLPLIPFSASYGVIGLAILIPIVESIVAFVSLHMGAKVVDFTMSKMCRNVLPALVSSGVMSAVVILLATNVEGQTSVVRLLIQVFAGATAYTLTLWLFFRKQAVDAINLVCGRRVF